MRECHQRIRTRHLCGPLAAPACEAVEGIRSLKDVKYAIRERNGSISIIKRRD